MLLLPFVKFIEKFAAEVCGLRQQKMTTRKQICIRTCGLGLDAELTSESQNRFHSFNFTSRYKYLNE